MPARTTAALVAIGALLAPPVAAQESAADWRPTTPNEEFSVIRFDADEVDVQIDGRLDEAVWDEIDPLTDFVQGAPVEGVPAEHDTEVRVLFTDEAVIVAARMWDSAPDEIATQLVRRDGRGTFDWIQVGFDTNLDRRTGYVFQVSAAGVQSDEYLYDDQQSDAAWDAVWESAVAIDDRGWTAEIRIPLSQIRFQSSDEPQVWGVNFQRRRVANGEITQWKLVSRTQQGVVSQFGRMEGVHLPNAVRRIEARPYVLSSLERADATPGNPFFDGQAESARIGTDLRVGLGSAFTLDAAINPDFGQVESDPAQINLTAFEVFQEERRPFFVEDANLLNFTLSGRRNSLFYSRRIGRSPSGDAPSGSDFEEMPEAATILGAAKVTGRTSGGLSVGALFAATADESARAYYVAEDRFEEFRVEPAAQFGVVRLQQDFNRGASQVNGIVTGMRRGLPEDGSFDFLPSSAFSAGVSFEHQWGDRTWALQGTFAGAHTRRDSLAMYRLQTSSNHLWQRPDATRAELDPDATSMSGAEWRLQFERRRGDHWTGGVWLGQVTRGFEINDIGFSSNREKLDAGMRVGYRQIRPQGPFRSYGLNFFTFHNWSHEALDDVGSWSSWRRAQTTGYFSLNGRAELKNFWEVNGDIGFGPDTWSQTATRGGPVMLDPSSLRSSLRIQTDRRKAVSFSAGMNLSEGGDDSGESFSVNAGIQMRPSPNVEVSISPNWSEERTAAQYVTSTSTLPYEPTFGRRYLFAELERRTLSMETRVDMTFSPTLTFQLFAQPFLSSGDYQRYRQLETPGSFDFVDWTEGTAVTDADGDLVCVGGSICRSEDRRQNIDFDGDGTIDYAFADRDFNYRSLLGNAVLRWEYRPGSTIFLVWQRQQAVRARVGDFDVRRDLGALFDAPARNVFMLKVNLWIGM